MNGLFAYGTLLFASVVRAVLGRDLQSIDARLDGFARRRLAGEVFPAIVAAPGEHVDGLLYRDLDEETWLRLDAFEGALYRRSPVVVTVATGGRAAARIPAANVAGAGSRSPAVPRAAAAPPSASMACLSTEARAACTYVLSERARPRLLPDAWSPEDFARDHLAAFGARLRRSPGDRARSSD